MPKKLTNTSSSSNSILRRVSQFEQQQQEQSLTDDQMADSSEESSNVNNHFINVAFERFKHEFIGLYPESTLPFEQLDSLNQARHLLGDHKNHIQSLTKELNRCKFTVKFLEEIINRHDKESKQHGHHGSNNIGKNDEILVNDDSMMLNTSVDVTTNPSSSQYVTVITLNDSAYGEIQKISPNKTSPTSSSSSSVTAVAENSIENNNDDGNGNAHHNETKLDHQQQQRATKTVPEPIYSNTLETQKSTLDKAKKRPPTPPRKPKLPNKSLNSHSNNSINNIETSAISKPLSSQTHQQSQLTKSESLTTTNKSNASSSSSSYCNRSQFQRKFNGPLQRIDQQHESDSNKMNNKRFNKKSITTNNQNKVPYMRTFSLEPNVPSSSTKSNRNMIKRLQQTDKTESSSQLSDYNNIYDTVAPDDSDGIDHDDDPNNDKANEDCDNRTNEHNLTSNDEEMETSSQEMLSRSSSTDELSNYVNIDYFLRKNSVGRSNSNIPVASRLSSSGNRKISSSGLNVEESENENETLSSMKSSSDYDHFGSSDNLLKQFQIPANDTAKSSYNSIGTTTSTSSASSLRLRNAKLLNKESNNIESNYPSISLMSTFTPPPSIHDKEFNFFKPTAQTLTTTSQETSLSEKDENFAYSEGSDFNQLMDTSSSSPQPKNIPSTSSPSAIALETDFYAFADIIHHDTIATTTGTIADNLDSINTSDDSLDRDEKSISTKFEHQGSLKSTITNNNFNIENLIDEDNKRMNVNKTTYTTESDQSQQMQWSIVRSIIDSETIYLDCLNTLNKYRKAFESASKGDNALISIEDLDTIFYRIANLYDIHNAFLAGLKKVEHGFKLRHSSMMADSKLAAKLIGKQSIGELFNRLAEQLPVYADFLRNYSKAIETANRCSANNLRFFDIIKSIKLASAHVQFSNLVDMLHEPVARLQKNALVLHDLLKYTENDDDQRLLKNALRLNQKFLNDLNLDAARRLFMTHDKFKRRLVKESFIIESGDRRKLRHLFLFNDVIVSAKYKASSKQKFTFELRWFQMLNDIVLDSVSNLLILTNSSESSQSCSTIQPQSSSSSVQHTLNGNTNNSNQSNQHELEKESKDIQTTANLISSLKSRAFSARLDLYIEEKRKGHTKQSDRLRKKISELESELSLYLPQLKFSFRVKNNPSKYYTFFLSSEYERNCWIDAIKTLQQHASSEEHANIHVLQKWIESCRKSINVNCGSFLLRSNKDETLRYGDLQMRLVDLGNFHYHADLFIVIETDSFGHYFKRAVARYLMRDFIQKQNRCQEFLIELEGSQIVRFLLYEKCQQQQISDYSDKNGDENRIHQLNGKAIFELTSSCASTEPKLSEIQIGDYTLCFETRFIPWNSIMETIPPNKIYGAFGVSISQVCKKEKSTIPYLILSCILEVERRGLREVGIYRVSGLSSEVQKLKKAFETNPRDACYLIRETDIHSVTGLLKLYLRELPESLFTNDMYQKYFEARDLKNSEEKEMKMTSLLAKLIEPNQSTVIKLIEHLVLINHFEEDNKMSLNNLATVFGPTMLRTNSSSTTTSSSTSAMGHSSSGSKNSILSSSATAASHQQMIGFGGSSNANQMVPNITPLMINTDLFTASTIDVMAQADILYFFLRRKADGYSLTSVDHQEETSL